ncbi:orotidine-5'-phosphate decarboxylase [Luteolibacter ambystomatis]|nr:orotidine-5'-phosphate decarboxylase [Luteolibacter ambystomatis]
MFEAIPGLFSIVPAAGATQRPAMRYAERLQNRIAATGSRLCVGLDPRPGDGGAAEAKEFLRRVIGETWQHAAAFKPNMAYFEALGIAGVQVLEELLLEMPKEVPVILDAKRSDIGETQKYYAQGYFSRWNVDAVTLNPFLGYDSIEPFLDWEGKGIYLLAVTSNPGSADFQRQTLADGRSVFELVTALGDRAATEGRKTDVGYVVGLTNASGVFERVPDAPLLVPGLGAQGGDLAALANAGRNAPDTINVSRGILYAGDDQSFEARAKVWAEKIAVAYGL